MSPAPVTHCRVLEIGTGDGSNLIPMAYELPESRFLGIDLAGQRVVEGRRAIAALELDNIALEVADLCDIGADAGEFDYIVAHGVYSWVSPEVRDRLLAVCGERLAPGGIAFVSYNAYPGSYFRRVVREMMLYDGRGVEEPGERIARARRFLEFLRGGGLLPAAYQEWIESEVRAAFERGGAGLYHDDLAEFNEPAWFHEFVAHARRHHLAYVGEAEPYEMFDLRGALEGFEGGAIEREQYLDFLKLRRFRQTLVCREEAPLDRGAGPARMDRFLFSAPAQRSGGHPEKGDSPAFYEGNRGVKITAGNDAAERVAGALGDAFPLPVAFEELVAYAGDRDTLREVAWMFVISGFADLHVHDFPCEETVTERPVASRLARY